MEKQGVKETAQDLTGHVSGYLDTLYKLSLLNLRNTATNITSVAISTIIVFTPLLGAPRIPAFSAKMIFDYNGLT